MSKTDALPVRLDIDDYGDIIRDGKPDSRVIAKHYGYDSDDALIVAEMVRRYNAATADLEAARDAAEALREYSTDAMDIDGLADDCEIQIVVTAGAIRKARAALARCTTQEGGPG